MKRRIVCASAAMIVCVSVAFADNSAMATALRERNMEAVKAILERDPNAANEPDASGVLPLYRAMTKDGTEMVELLLAHKADPTLKNEHGYSSMYYTLSHEGKRRYLRLFLEKGANVNDQDKEGKSLLCLAVANNLPEYVELLLASKADIDLQDKDGNAPMHVACNLKNGAKVLELLLVNEPKMNLAGRNGETPLHIACRLGDMQLAKLLLDHKADPDMGTATRFHEAPIHYCAKYVAENAGELTALLLKAKADPNCRDEQGKTPLHHAALHNNVAAAKALVAGGADVNARDARNKFTPFEMAQFSRAYPTEEVRSYLKTVNDAAKAAQ